MKSADTSVNKNTEGTQSVESVSAKITALEELKRDMAKSRRRSLMELMDKWRKALKSDGWGKYGLLFEMGWNERAEVSLRIKGVKCGCISWAENPSPYWYFWTEKGTETPEQVQMIKEILSEAGFSECEVSESSDGAGFVAKGTYDGYEDCKKLFDAARRLGHLTPSKA